MSRLKPLLLLAVLVSTSILSMPLAAPAHGATAFIQEASNEAANGSSITCTYSGSVTNGDELLFAVSTTTASTAISSITDTLGDTFAEAVGTAALTASVDQVGAIYTAEAGATGSNAITVSFTATVNQPEVDCLEYSGVGNTVDFTRIATGSATGSAFGQSISPYNSHANDLVYAYTAFTACDGTSQVNYDAMFTAGSAGGSGSGKTTGTNCKNAPLAKAYSANQADEWSDSMSAFSTSAGFAVGEGYTVAAGSSGWLEMVVELGSSASTSQPLSLDGTCKDTIATAGTSTSCSLTTGSSSDIFVASLDLYTTTATSASVTDSSCSSWTEYYPSSTGTDFLFYCKSAGVVTSDTVTATTTASDKATLVVYAVAGADYSSPWDPNSGLPAVTTGTSTSPHSSVSTTTKYDLVISQVRTAGAPTVTLQPGFASLGSGSTSSGVVQDSYAVVTSALSSFSEGPTLSSSHAWASIGAALEGAPTAAAPTVPATAYTLATSAGATATRQSSQEKTFQAEGQFWYFTYDSTGFACQTSNNGQQLSSKYYIYQGAGQGGQMEVKYNSTTNTLYAAVTDGSQTQVPWQIDIGSLPTSNPTCGGISWTLFQKDIDLSGLRAVTSPSIYWDTAGHVWGFFQGNMTGNYGFEAWECTTVLSSCGTDSSWTEQLSARTDLAYSTNTGYEDQMGEFTGGEMWFIYGSVSTARPITIYTWSGSAMNSPVNTTGDYTFSGPNSGRGINLGTTLDVFTPDSSGTGGVGGAIKDISCSYPCSTISETTVYSSTTVLIVAAATDGSARIVLTFAFANQTTVDDMWSSNGGSTWSTPVVLARDSGISDTSLTTDFSYAHDGNVTLTYTDNAGGSSYPDSCVTPCGVRIYYFAPGA